MTVFEVGKRYHMDGATVEIISRTKKFVTCALVFHEGRFNEHLSDAKKVKVHNWNKGEAIFYNPYEFYAWI